jgi:hypothetical protein
MLNPGDRRKRIHVTVSRTAPENPTEKSLAAKIEFTRNLLRCGTTEGLHPDAPAWWRRSVTRALDARTATGRSGEEGEKGVRKKIVARTFDQRATTGRFIFPRPVCPSHEHSLIHFDFCLSRALRVHETATGRLHVAFRGNSIIATRRETHVARHYGFIVSSSLLAAVEWRRIRRDLIFGGKSPSLENSYDVSSGSYD